MTRSRVLAAALSISLSLSLGSTVANAQDDPLARARKALALSKYDLAREELDKTSASLDRAELEVRLLLWTGKYVGAAEAGRRAMGNDEAKVRLAPWLAESLVRQGKLREAIAVLEQVTLLDGAHRANVLLGDLLIRDGKRSAAEAPLMRVIDAYNADEIKDDDPRGMSLVARSAHLLRVYGEANDAFNMAEQAGAKKLVESMLWRTELFLDKFNPGHAAETARDALQLAPNDPRAHVAMAQVRLAQTMNFAAAEEHIDKALKIDPNLAEAYFVRTGLALRTMELDQAMEAVEAGLKHDPTNLELLSIKAATYFLGEDEAGFAEMETKVLTLNPEYSRFYSIVGEFAEWEHRYAKIVEMMRKAVKVDDKDAKAYASMGLNLIRDGDDHAGLEALNKAWRRDKFNMRVLNTLDLFENTIPKEYTMVDGTRFRVRYYNEEKAVLERYLPQLLDRAWNSMVQRYGFTPKQPVSIEMYADTQHFSIRTSGLPNVGIQGVCFGQTLAALSPAAGSYNWGMVVWHELAHVFHIQQSQSRVPRWFTEGLAEYETIIVRPEWQREEDIALFQGLRAGKIPKVARFNQAFTHAEQPQDITMAYFAASQISVFLADEFGFDKIVAHLPGWAAGKRTPEVVQEVLGIDADELDRRYRAWLEKRLERYSKQFVPDLRPPKSLEEAQKAVQSDPTNVDKLVKLAIGQLAEGKIPDASATLQLALGKAPNHPDALFLKLRVAMGTKKFDDANTTVQRMISTGSDGYAVRMKAADLAELNEAKDEMREHFFKAHDFDPSQAEPIAALYDLARKDKDETTELNMLRLLSRLEQHDRRVWRRLLKLLVKRGAWEDAIGVGESAMYVDVMNPEVHYLYGRALARFGRHVSAIREMNSALLAKPPPKLQVEIYEAMAEGYRTLGKDEFAERATRYAGQVLKLAPVEDEPDDEGLRHAP